MPSTPRKLRSAVAGVISLVFAVHVQADPLGVGNAGAVFRLQGDSSFQEGCFPPCMCPILMREPLMGTMRVAYLGFDNAVHDYQVLDVNFIGPGGDAPRIIGSGKYSVGTPAPITVLQHRLQLDLQVGDDPLQHFDSGWQPLQNSTGIDIAVSINGMYCWDRVLEIHAERVPASQITAYQLGGGATYQFGCFGICDCAVGPEQPMRGTFALVPLGNNTLFQYFAVIDVNWQVPDVNNATDTIVLRGVGIYSVGGEFAVQQRLLLDLRLTNTGPTRFDSGLVTGGGQFPHLDVVVPQEHLYEICSGSLLHVVADPADIEVCGGFAGIPCSDPADYCRLPVGHCCCDFQGVCTPRPEWCIDVWDPVCGCDGITYSNECYAASAGVSIAHFGICDQVCGGVSGEPCDVGYFCKLPPGSCDMTDPQGTCTLIPSACPLYYDPVCGCDGNTYGNECEADAAGVSIDHPGVCSAQCMARRDILDPQLAYCNGELVTIHIDLAVPNTASAVAVEDAPAVAWQVVSISHGGAYDAVNNKIKWGPFFPPFPTQLSYQLIASDVTNYGVCWNGAISVDGNNSAICGDQCMHIQFDCCPRIPPDQPHEACADCPVAGCTDCNGSACNDGQVSLCETIAYACAWMHGCNDDLAGMTRAAYLWRNGECYCWSDAGGNWSPADCSLASSCCSGGAAAIGNATSGEALATPRIAFSSRPRLYELTVPISIAPPQGTSANALELRLPKGWKITSVSDNGRYDSAHGKVKWGPFLDDSARTVTVRAARPVSRTDWKLESAAATPSLSGISGTVSFDGINQPVTIKR